MKTLPCLLTALALTLSASAAPGPVKGERIPSDTYSSFVKNWDDSATPVFAALISSDEEWKQVNGAAAFMGNKKPFGPDADSWKTSQILLLTRVMDAPKGNMDSAYKVNGLQLDAQGTLTVNYSYKAPAKNSFTVKNPLMIQIPKGKYDRVVFVENGKTVAELDPGKGVWVKPEPPKE